MLPHIDSRNPYKGRIDLMCTENNMEDVAIGLLNDLKSGKIKVADLMGPLYQEPDLTPTIEIPAGTVNRVAAAPSFEFEPHDEHNEELVRNVHPPNYDNPSTNTTYDLVVIGAGVSGLLSVITAKWLGKKCALIEKHAMGGDCLNIGCVPSKALIACAREFQRIKNAHEFGIQIPSGPITIDFGHVMRRMRAIRAKISHHDSVSRYSKEFCEHVYVGEAKFSSEPNVVTVHCPDGTSRSVHYKKAMIASGASASVPPILADKPHLTNANFFNLTELPPRMLVVGCGPIGLELSQSMSAFGCEVTGIEYFSQILTKEDPEAAAILTSQLQKDGVKIITNASLVSVEITNADYFSLYQAPWPAYVCRVKVGDEIMQIECDAILNATGRVPNVFDLNLDLVNVEYCNRQGVHINDYFQTTNKNIYSCGDCATAYKFTHSADFQARLAIRNMFLGDCNKLSHMLIPWCTYTHPEIAHVGKYESELQAKGIQFESFKRDLAPVDRCLCDGITEGFVKITVRAGTDQIIGATICAPDAGSMISELTVCMQYGIGLTQLAGVIHPYPTVQESIRQCALQIYKYFKDPKALPLTVLRLRMQEIEDEEASK